MGVWLKELDVAAGPGRRRVTYAICELHMNRPRKRRFVVGQGFM